MSDPVIEAKTIPAAVDSGRDRRAWRCISAVPRWRSRNLRTDDGDDGLGANGAEYAVEMTSPKLPETDLPPGPDSEASQFQPQQMQQQAEVKETDLPKEMPQEAEDPDRLVTENDSKKPVEDTTKVAKVETQAVEEMPNAEESARQALNEDAREDEKAAAPNQGIGKDIRKLTAEWGKRISAYFELHKRYPKDKSKTTTVKLSLVLNRRGNVVSVDVAEVLGRSRLRQRGHLHGPPLGSRADPAGRAHGRSVRLQPAGEFQEAAK